MAGTLSGGISIQGLGSGIDFGEMIDQLKSIESIPKARMEVWRAEWVTRVDAFKDILSCMKDTKSALSALSTMDKMLLRTVNSSRDTVATAKADSNIDEGVYTIDVQQLATASVFSNKKSFDSKQAKLTTDGDKTFAYTYKGVRRELTVANNTTLENFVNQINKDSGNPGVRASLIKSGSGYIFQLQGKDTGSSATLNIESDLDGFDSTPLFSGRDVVINNTGGDQTYTYEYGGKKRSLAVTDGMTAAQFIDKFNAQNSGVTASLELKGSNYVIQMRDTQSKNVVKLPASTDCEALGGDGFTVSGFDPATTRINTSGDPQQFSYNYLGKTYTVNVGTDFTMDDLVDKINATPPDGVTAAFDASTGKIKFTATDKVLTTTDTTFKFRQLNDGQTLTSDQWPSLDVPAGTTLKEFVQMFNKHEFSVKQGYKASVEDDGAGNQSLVVKDKTGQKVNLFAPGDPSIDATTQGLSIDTGIPDLAPTTPGGQQELAVSLGPLSVDLCTASTLPGLGGRAELDGRDVAVNGTGAADTFSFTAPDGSAQTLNVPAGTTMRGFVDAFNAQFNTAGAAGYLGIEARAVAMGSGYEIHYFKQGANGEEEVQLADVNAGGMDMLSDSGDNWYSKQATDALFTMNGWPQVMSSETNNLTEVVEGLNITLKSTGETSLTVANDKDALKENIRTVVDTINSLRSKLKELTKVDTTKDVSKPEVNDSTGLLKLQSQFTWQFGSTLTGNYGVQMLATRLKNLTAESADGFVGRKNKDDLINDQFTNWAQIGIGTVTDESDPEAGLLRIDEAKLDEALDADIRNVAELFSSASEGSTDSSDFSIASVGTRAKPGTYNVTYDVVEYTDPDTGEIKTKLSDVYINGVKANTDSAFPGRYTVGDLDNDAAGLAIQFTEADLVAGSYSNSVRVKQGKVGEMIDLLSAEIQPVVKGSTEKAGAIPLLIDNYSNPTTGIIASIDKKIERETSRLTLWEKRQRAQFNRLDAMLTKMNQTMEKNASVLGQMSNNNSSS